MPYLDTSILIAALTNKVGTVRVQTWLGEQVPGDLTISEWVDRRLADAAAALGVSARLL